MLVLSVLLIFAQIILGGAFMAHAVIIPDRYGDATNIPLLIYAVFVIISNMIILFQNVG